MHIYTPGAIWCWYLFQVLRQTADPADKWAAGSCLGAARGEDSFQWPSLTLHLKALWHKVLAVFVFPPVEIQIGSSVCLLSQ